ncbi:MAG: hypothetical protein V4754_07440 [Pseudomonadota bacterium]
MDCKEAYDYFLKKLSTQLVRVINELDNCQLGSSQYAALTQKQNRIQTALANLDEIANFV